MRGHEVGDRAEVPHRAERRREPIAHRGRARSAIERRDVRAESAPNEHRAVERQHQVPRELGLEPRPSLTADTGAIEVTLDTEPLKQTTPSYFWYSLLIHRLHGEDGSLYGGAEYIPKELKPDQGN